MLYDVELRKEVARAVLKSGWVNGLSYCPSRHILIAGTTNGSLVTLEPDTLDIVSSQRINFWINSVRWNCASARAILGTAEGVLLSYDTARPEQFTELPLRHTDQVWDCAVSECNEYFVTVGGNGEIALWDTRNHAFLGWLSKGGYVVTSAVFLDPFNLLATVDMGGVLTFWSLRDRHPTCRFNAHDARIWTITTSKDRHRVLTASADNTVCLWSVPSGQLLAEYKLEVRPIGCAAHRDNQRVFVGDSEGRISTIIMKAAHVSAAQSGTEMYRADISGLLAANRVVIFILDPRSPYSRRLVASLNEGHFDFFAFDISSSPTIKATLARISGCPLFPQIYIDGRFFGGSAVLLELIASGTLGRMLGIPRR